jgi:putative addiction module component (TIGR02574 family)
VNARAKHVLAEALELTADDRAALAEELLASFHGQPDPKADGAWAKLIERRAREVADGNVTGPECRPFLEKLIGRLERGQ